MIEPLATAVITVTLVMAAVTGLLAAVDRRPGRVVLGALGVTELVVLAQVIAAVVVLIAGQRPAGNTVEFLGYHVAALLVLPAGYAWSLADRSRWAVAVLTAACLAVAVMTVRMNQLWAGFGG